MRAGCLAVLALVLTPQDDLRPGLVAEIYSLPGPLDDFPKLAPDRKPDLRRIDPAINIAMTDGALPGTSMADHLYVRWKGILRLPREAKYTFYLESDDGSRLRIGSRTILENGGLHAMEEKSAEAVLGAGDHEIELELFENTGELGFRFSWEAEGLPKEIVPAKVFLHKRDKDLDKDP
jgi:hypothetical protein